jgi:hypothetical protein
VDHIEQAASHLLLGWHIQGSSREADMGTSADRPKPKPGQSAGEHVSGSPKANPKKGGGTGPIAQTAADVTESSAKTPSSATPAAETKADANKSSAKKTSSAAPTAQTTSGPLTPTSRTSRGKTTTRLATKKAVNKAPSVSANPPPPQVLATRHDRKRDPRREELSRKIEERRQQRQRELRNRQIIKWSIIGVPTAVVLIGVGILLYNQLIGLPLPAPLKGDPIDGIRCNALEQLASHYHTHLQIYVNGQEVPIPTDVGRQSVTGCYYWLHTHALAGDDGVIHIESPDNQTYDLQQFFDIWGQQLSATNVLGYKVDASHQLTAYVYEPTDQPTDDTQPFTVTPPSTFTPYTGDVTKIVLKPHELIEVEYGTTLVPPQPFTFLAGE